MLNLHFSFASTRGLKAGEKKRGTQITDEINRLQLFHGSIRGSFLLLNPERISLSVGPSVLLGAEQASQHAGQAVGDRRVCVAVFVTVFVCV